MPATRTRTPTGSRFSNAREQHSLIAISTGGGMMEVIAVDGFNVSMFGDCFETLLWVESARDASSSRSWAL